MVKKTTPIKKINWEKYEATNTDMCEGLAPEEYVRKLRENDRDEMLF